MKLDFLTISLQSKMKKVNAVILFVRGEGRGKRKEEISKSTNKRENKNNYLYWVVSTKKCLCILKFCILVTFNLNTD
jgi:hypothetical protein